MPEPFFTDHAWDYNTNPAYRQRYDRNQKIYWTVVTLFVLVFVGSIALLWLT